MTGRPTHSRESSSYNHRPSQPSALRNSYTAAQSSTFTNRHSQDDSEDTSESTPLFSSQDRDRHRSQAHEGACSHGTCSPRPCTPDNETLGTGSDGSRTPATGTTIAVLDDAITNIMGNDDWKKWMKKKMKTRKMGQSHALAEQNGFKDTPLMCDEVSSPLYLSVRRETD